MNSFLSSSFVLWIAAIVCALFAFLPLQLSMLRKPVKALLCGALCLATLACSFAACRAQQRNDASHAAFVQALLSVRLRDRVFILENTTAIPPDYAQLAKVEPRFGGIEGLSGPDLLKWRTEKAAQAKAEMAETRALQEHLLREAGLR